MSVSRRSAILLALGALLLSVVFPAGAAAFAPLSGFAGEGRGAGQVDELGQLTIAPDGTVYVSDLGNNRIDVFSPDGEFRFAFGEKVSPDGADLCTAAGGCVRGGESGAAGSVGEPEGLALGPEGNLFVAAATDNRIDVFTVAGVFLYAFGREVDPSGGDLCTAASGCRVGEGSGSAGAMTTPLGVAVDAAGDVFVSDLYNNRIDVFTVGGTFLYAFGKEVDAGDHGDLCDPSDTCQAGAANGSAGAMGAVWSLAVTADGQVLAADRPNERIDIFTIGGEFLRAFGREVNPDGSGVCTTATTCRAGTDSPAGAPGAIGSPEELALAPDGSVYVGDSGNRRVDQFGLDGSFERAFGAGVVAGGEAFEVCTDVSGCVQGANGPDGVGGARAVAVDCHGAVFVGREETGAAKIERYGEPGTPDAPCPPPAAVTPTPASTPTPPPATSRPSDRIRLGRLVWNRKKGTARLLVVVPGPGTVAVSGRGIARATSVTGTAGRVDLPLRPTGKVRRRLSRSGRARVTVVVSFTPNGGTTATRATRRTLKENRTRRSVRGSPPRR